MNARVRGLPVRPRSRWPWPLPALMCWAAAALVAATLRHATGALQPVPAALPAWAAWLAGSAVGAALAWRVATTVPRRLLAAGGFPLALVAPGLPAWAWGAAALLLALLYPRRAWRDAPFFPTPAAALRGLATVVGAPPRVLDAGCGAGDALRALARELPGAALHGTECSAPLAWLARLRCPRARVDRGDLWRQSWRGFDLVYLFQRPESMAAAWAKAQAEQAAGAWLASLEFAVPGVRPAACLQAPGGRALWLYRVDATEKRGVAGAVAAQPAAPGGR